MMILAGTTDLIRITTAAATTLDVYASWVDNTTSAYTPGRTGTRITTATTTTIVGSPAASTQRQIKQISVQANTGQAVTIFWTDGATFAQLVVVTLQNGDSLNYDDAQGWYLIDSQGALRTATTGIGRLLRAPQVLTAGTTYNKPAGCTSILVELVGGGGGGGGVAAAAAGQIAMGSGGGSGGYASKYYASVPTSCTYAIGAAGAAGANTGAVAGNGGNTTFTDGSTLVTAFGGAGAPAGIASGTTDVWLNGGAGGVIATNGDANQGGQSGGPCNRCVNTGLANQAISGAGANGPWGGGGAARITTGAGANAIANSGAGGGGALALASGAAAVGGAGGAGIIVVWEYS